MTAPAMTKFRGRVFEPGDPGYDEQRTNWLGMTVAQPAIVVEAADASDVQAAVSLARERGLPFAVQSTGHGSHVPTDGVMVTTSALNTVSIDPRRRVARVGAGAVWSQVLEAAAPYGLVPVSGSHASVGVVGYTLGGGVGWLSRAYGFGADNVVSAEVVTADGRVVTASADSHPDLFWAIRGGGANFGVVTSITVRLHKLPSVTVATAEFPASSAAEVLTRYREWAPTQPRELTTSVVVSADRVVVNAMYAGRKRPNLSALGAPTSYKSVRIPYAEASLGGTAPRHFSLHRTLPDDVMRAIVNDDTADAVEIRYWGGAMADGDAPVSHRDAPFAVTVGGPVDIAPSGASFVNFLHDTTRTHTAYTAANYLRLRQIKRQWDPENTFGLTHNIPPVAPDSCDQGRVRPRDDHADSSL